MNRPDVPTYKQCLSCTLLLLALSACLAPLSFAACFITFIFRNYVTSPAPTQDRKPLTVLINGAKMYKALGLIRQFGKAGCRVILADQGSDGILSASRLSRYVSQYYRLPTPVANEETSCSTYVQALLNVATIEKVDLFVPCSGAGSTIEDAKAGEEMKNALPNIKVFIPSAQLSEELHEKDKFMQLLADLNVQRPETYTVSSVAEALNRIKVAEHPMIMKATAVLDDLGRNDMTLYPLAGDSKEDLSRTRHRLERGLSIPISPKTPYVLQQFISGEEFCTHATVVDNELRAIVCCPSNDMLMRYEDITQTDIGRQAEQWTNQFLEAWAASERGRAESINGHISMDFIQDKDGSLYPIECNPRVHTAICLLSTQSSFVYSYLSQQTSVVRPRPHTKPRSWLGHDIPAIILPSRLPLLRSIHPLISQKRQPFSLDTVDPMFQLDDPWPFFGLYHVQWPFLLLRQLLVRRKKWQRINASTSRIFECP